jgi:putative ABC transport system permease protein
MVTRMRDIWQDARHGFRLLRREPGFALVAVFTIALGIGATTTLFSVANGVLLKPLAWPDADRLVKLTETRGGHQARLRGTITNGTYVAWHDAPQTVEAVAAYGTTDATAIPGGTGEPARIEIGRVTPTLFSVLRAQPLRGRIFTEEDAKVGETGAPQPAPVIVLSYGLWQQWFGGRDDIIGQPLVVDGRSFTVVAVMPKGFAFPNPDTRAWWPMAVGAVMGDGGVFRIQIFSALARLRPGFTAQQAASEGTARARGGQDPALAAVAMFGSSAPPDITATPAMQAMTADVRPAILMLLAAVGLLMLTATANVASLQLARATTRRREIAVRAALGAGGSRLTRQLVVESALLGGAGGALGLLSAMALHRALPSLLPADFPRVTDIAIDLRVLAFATVASLAISIACGLLPALQARRINLVEALAADGAASTGGVWRSRSGRLRAIIMAGQVAVACVLLVGAALLARSFVALLRADRGYDPANVLTARVDLPASYTVERRVAFVEAMLERLRGTAGVSVAAAGNALPLLTAGNGFAFTMPSPQDPAVKMPVQTTVRVVSPGYFRAMRLRLVSGRLLGEGDGPDARGAVVVNRSFVQRYLGDMPLGKPIPISFANGQKNGAVVGIVDDMRQGDMDDPKMPELFVSYKQLPGNLVRASTVLVVRTLGDPIALVPALRTAVREQDRQLAVDSIMTMEERVATALAKPRIYAVLLGAFAAVAVIIAGVGLFAVLCYNVAQRSREIGVRTAIGATPRQIAALILRQALVMAGAGLAAGLALALAVVRFLSTFLYGVTAYDAASFVIVPILLAGMTAIACIVPARRAARVDPMVVLRSST